MRPRIGELVSTLASSLTVIAFRSACAAASMPAVGSSVDHRDGPIVIDHVSDTADVRQAHGKIDVIVSALPPAAEPRHDQADRARVHPRDHAGSLRRHGQRDRRLREIAIGMLHEIRRTTERRRHAAESLGRSARCENPIDRARCGRLIRRPVRPARASRRRRAAVTACSRACRRPTGQNLDRLTDLERIAHVVAERLGHVGQQDDGRETGLVADREQALRQSRRRLERSARE